MRRLGIILLFFPGCVVAQDTLILRNNSKMIVNILYTTNDEVIYTKVRDKDRSFIIPFSRLKSIAFRDSIVKNLEDINITPNTSASREKNSDSIPANISKEPHRKRDLEMYRRGVKDAAEYYTFDEFVTYRKVSPHLFVMAGIFGSIILTSSKEVDIDFPDQNLFKYADYRRGYLDKVKKLKWKYRLILSGAAATSAILIIAFNKFA